VGFAESGQVVEEAENLPIRDLRLLEQLLGRSVDSTEGLLLKDGRLE